jgi:outer membrane protein
MKLLIAIFTFFALSEAYTADLEDIYRAARDNDPVLGAAEASRDARKEAVPQARAALLPSMSVSGNRSRSRRDLGPRLDTNPTSPTFGQLSEYPSQNFSDHGWSAQLRQPVVNVSSWINWRSAKASVVQAEWDYLATEQSLYVRVAEAYLNVLRAHDRLEATVAEEEAIQRQLEQIQQRFNVGLVAITDVLESTAAYDNAVVRRIQADGDRYIFFEGLRTITGNSYDEINRVSEELPIVDPDPRNEDQWVSVALAESPQIKSAQEAVKVSERTVRSRLATHLPTVDGVVNFNRSVSGGGGYFGNQIENRSFALSASVPLFQGGATHSRYKEARARLNESRQRLIEREFTTTRDTRNLFRAVITDVVRVQARLKAIRSSESALEATQIGYEVGTRNIVEVLQAQQRLFSSQFDYADSRYNYLLNLLRLKQSTGVLEEIDLIELNQFIDQTDKVTKLTTLSGT